MARLSVIAFLSCVFPLVASAHVENDPIREKLTKAKAEYEAEMKTYTQNVNEYFDKREDAARTAGNKKLVDQIKTERKMFKEDGEVPKTLPTAVKQIRTVAQTKMMATYELTIRNIPRRRKTTRRPTWRMS